MITVTAGVLLFTNMNQSMLVARDKSFALETKRRLSQSVLWKLQREYFERQGIEAWSANAVPHHITSSPFIADAYARIVFGFMRDCSSAANPLHIVELGSGSGRFAYLFLRRFLELYQGSVLKDVPIEYVMTDLAERNLEYWRSHPRFQPFVEAGLLDFARFDVEHEQALKLNHSGATNLQTPIVVIANYIFDSLPQDAFFVSGGHLFETLVGVVTPEEERDVADPEILSRVELSYDYNPVNGNYYKDPAWNRILTDYTKRLTATPFLFPTAALQCIRNLRRLSSGPMLLLSGDRGYSSDEALLEGKGAPVLAMHGAVSLMVDYQIIGEYCRELGGQVLHPARQAENLNVSAFLLADHRFDSAETRQAYSETIGRFGPDDLFTLKQGIVPLFDSLSLDQILAFLRLSCWDYLRFWECLPALKKHLPDLSHTQKQEVHETILKVWDYYLPIGEENDLAFAMGTLLLEMEFHAEALEFLQRSVELYGIAPGSAYNIAVCYYSLDRMDQALEYVDQALNLDYEFAEAKTLRTALQSAL